MGRFLRVIALLLTITTTMLVTVHGRISSRSSPFQAEAVPATTTTTKLAAVTSRRHRGVHHHHHHHHQEDALALPQEKKVSSPPRMQVARGGAAAAAVTPVVVVENSVTNAVLGSMVLCAIEKTVKEIFKANDVKFPPMLGGCIFLFFFLIATDMVAPRTANFMFQALSPSAALLAKVCKE
jgi:hypothetical protein